jgi:hypothetical protein
MYQSEKALVNKFVVKLRSAISPWGSVSIGREFRYEGGRTDVIALQKQGQLLAFEAKLTNWRDALAQAYRATFFAHRSYVLLPESTARLAEPHFSEFHERRVGLCSMRGENLAIVFDCETSDPLQTWVHQAAFQMIGGSIGPRSATQDGSFGLLHTEPSRVPSEGRRGGIQRNLRGC